MSRLLQIVVGALLLAMGNAHGQESLQKLVRTDPGRIERLLDEMDLQKPPLAQVRDAAAQKDWGHACEALLSYYRQAEVPSPEQLLGKPDTSVAAIARADAVLNDTFTFYDQTAKVPRRPDGGLQWDYTGPANDKEWAWALNRHFHLNWLLDAYLATGDAKYAAAWDASVRDWIRQNPYAEPNQNPLVWRGLETFFRVRAWARGFYALQKEPAFTPATRILLLSSVPDHARYLRQFHQPTGNWISMELNGLATAGVAWPEFKDADAWVDYSVTRLTRELTGQVYPDGAQMELTAHYHRATLSNFQAVADLLRPTGREVPAAFSETVERMWSYLAYTLRPSGYSPLNNDSNLDFNGPRIVEQAGPFSRPDWLYVGSNGKEGTRPQDPPSRTFPWAGQLVMRNGWDREAQWAFFDAGPMGTGHRHADKLHLSISAFGRDLLVDAGRYTYVGNAWRRYFVGSTSHNVILVDGHGQKDSPFKTDVPITGQFVTTPDYDLGYGKFDSGYEGVDGSVSHERLVYYKRGAYWIVVDRVTTDKPHLITALWHFHPDCRVVMEGQNAVSTDAGKGNMRIVPSEGKPWSVRLVAGQESPEIQGWYSREYNSKVPATAAVYDCSVNGTETFAWLLVPAIGVPPDAKLDAQAGGNRITCKVEVGAIRDRIQLEFGETPSRIELPWGRAPSEVR